MVVPLMLVSLSSDGSDLMSRPVLPARYRAAPVKPFAGLGLLAPMTACSNKRRTCCRVAAAGRVPHQVVFHCCR